MRKSRILVYANGWGHEYLNRALNGMYEAAKTMNGDIFVFVNFSKFSDSDEANAGEMDIFRLPDPKDFDGIIVMANSFNMEKEIDFVREVIQKTTLPVVSMEYPLEGAINIMTDNYNGMRKLAQHLIDVHSVNFPLIMCGSRGHTESEERKKAVLDTFHEAGLCVREEDILYGDWARVTAQNVLEQWYKREGRIPEAIICANDSMAEGAITWYENHGRKVPENAIVTGYDGTWLGQDRDVPLTTVSHEWKKMGYEAVKILLNPGERERILKEEKAEIVLDAGFMIGRSCGCTDGEVIERLVNGRSALRSKNEIRPLDMDSHFRHMYSRIRTSENADQFSKSMAELMTWDHDMEGADFALCMEKEFFENADYGKERVKDGYGEEMAVVCRLKNGTSMPYSEMCHRDIIFEVANECEQSRVYFFAPLQSEGVRFGYARLTRDLEITKERFLFIWTRHIDQYLEQFQRNIKIRNLTERLEKLSVTDFLTGVYNRTGCHQIVYPRLEEAHADGKMVVIMVADVDRMKTINDEYGHVMGDQALKIISDVLTKEMPRDWMVCRVGGDEFLIGGMTTKAEEAEQVRNHIMEELLVRAEKENVDYYLGISIGIDIVGPDEELDFDRSFQRADKNLYQTKMIHHREIDAG